MRLPFGMGRISEASPAQLAATGALGYGADADIGDGFRKLGGSGREIPKWTRDKAVAHSVNGYRANPMVKAIIDTYVAFCVGDSGLSIQCTDDDVRKIALEFWHDPRNKLDQEVMLRSHLLRGETLYEMLRGEATGVVRRNPIDTGRIQGIKLLNGNPLWPDVAVVSPNTMMSDPIELSIIQPGDITGLLSGDAMFWPSFQALETDVRGFPFLGPVLDQIESYDQVMSNLIDRTALARYMVWDVTIDGSEDDVKDFVKQRKGLHAPRSGTVEVHNSKVTWKPQAAQTGSYEDTNTSKAMLTNVAAGAGLAKTYIAESEDANKATAYAMAEPVRRRLGAVQNSWVGRQQQLARFAVDQAVIAGRLPAMVETSDGRQVLASSTVTISGPQIAGSDAKVTADVLNRLSKAIKVLQEVGALTRPAGQALVRKAWEDYMGVPYIDTLADSDNTDDIATAVDDAGAENSIVMATAA